MFTNNREAYRQAFYDAWQKHQKQLPLEMVEQQLVEIMLMHPEYHVLLNDEKRCQQEEFAVEENPFLHMSLHLALREQIHLDRPIGIKKIYQSLLEKHQDQFTAEHQMSACLAQTMWHAQQAGKPPEEHEYLEKLRTL